MNRPEFEWRDIRSQHDRLVRDLSVMPLVVERPVIINWPSLRGMFVTLVIVVALFGLLAVGR